MKFLTIRNIFIVAILLTLSKGQILAQEIGLQLYSLRNQMPKNTPGTLAKIKSWGIKEIEGGDTYNLSLEEYKKLLNQNGLTMVSVDAEFKQLAENALAAVAEAKKFATQYIVCYDIPHHEDVFTIEEVKNAVTVFNAAGKVLKENGISLCYHPHGYEFRMYGNGTLFDYLMSNTDAKYVNFEMDVFWVKHPGQDPVALLKRYPNRFLLMHLKDRKPGTEGNQNGHAADDTNVVLGTGDVGIAAVMNEAKKAGVKHFFIEDESSQAESQIPLSLAFLKKLK